MDPDEQKSLALSGAGQSSQPRNGTMQPDQGSRFWNAVLRLCLTPISVWT